MTSPGSRKRRKLTHCLRKKSRIKQKNQQGPRSLGTSVQGEVRNPRADTRGAFKKKHRVERGRENSQQARGP